jgi:hypothetical protein
MTGQECMDLRRKKDTRIGKTCIKKNYLLYTYATYYY